MSFYTANAELPHPKRAPRVEFVIYFALIFLLGVVLHVPFWIFQAVRHLRLPTRGPIYRAWKDAEHATPMIFRG